MTVSRNGLAARVVAICAPLAVGLACAAPAGAGVVDTPNACKFTYDGEYRTQGIEATATAPAEAVAGQPVTLTGEKLEVKLRPQLADDAAQTGLIPSSPEGTPSTIQTRTWFALKGTNTSQGTQVIGPITISATTTAYFDEPGQRIYATPFVYTAPKLPDTTWTATGGNIAFSQAGPGAITTAKGQLPVGPGGSEVTVQGSAVVQANLPGGVNFYMDCQPGETVVIRPQAGAGTTFNPLIAAPFANVAVAGAATNPGGKPPAGAAAAGTATSGRIASTKLVATGSRVRLRISCPAGGADCAGTTGLRSRSPVRIGKRRPAFITLARALKYTVVKGTSRTVRLLLSANAKMLLKRSAAHKVRLTLKPAKGKSIIRNLTLRRGRALGKLSPAGRTRTITVKNDAFSPKLVTVLRNTLVTWRWAAGSRPHNVVSRGAKRFTSSTVKSSGTHKVRFGKAGTYKYVCKLHEDQGMTGTLVVR